MESFPAVSSVTLASSSNAKAIGLISGAHLYSHFYLLLLPPIFPLLQVEFDVSYTALGFLLTVLNVVTGLTQAPVGMLVDRIGARTLLITALVVQSLAFAVMGLVATYPALVAMMVVAGLANAVYHPADYALLNSTVRGEKMGRAFSIHTAAGFFGGFLGPVVVIPLTGWFDWQTAILVSAASGMVMAAVMIAQSHALEDPVREAPSGDSASRTRADLALLLSAPVLMGLLFYVGLAMFGGALGNFSVSALGEMYAEVSLEELGIVLSAYLFAAPAGVLVGGGVADRIKRHDVFAAGCFVGIAVLVFCIAAIDLPLWMIAVLVGLAGLLYGLVAPSRDMLIRSMAKPGEMGRVFGFVSVGFNIGGMTAPLIFGYILDNADPTGVFWVAGFVALLTVPTVLVTGSRGRAATEAK